MSDQATGGPAAEALDRLAVRVVRLAEALEAAEVEVAAVRAECARLGVDERLAPLLGRLTVPSDVAEQLQDELDQLSGDLDEPPHRSSDASGGRLRGLGEPHPRREHLSVECPSCRAHITVPASEARDGTTPDDTDLDQRTYRCPRCGHEDTFETWDHFVEGDGDEAPGPSA